MIQSWPTPSPSAETLLVERKGDEVLFLNELRHRKNTAMKLRLPVSNTNLPAVQAALGKTGAFSGFDYRGIAVWSVVRPIPDSPWFIVAKIDRDEMERPIRRDCPVDFPDRHVPGTDSRPDDPVFCGSARMPDFA